MAKKKSKEDLDREDLDFEDSEEPEKKGSKIASALIAIVIIAIWLVIFSLLIKMDIGGVGSMLKPYLKNVPGINMILPEDSDEEVAQESGYDYKTMSEAIARIQELETELANYQNTSDSSAQTISDLQAQVARLKTFEDNQENYEELKDEFDQEVVYTDNAPDISEYKSWYEQMDPDNAATIYKEVVEQIQYSDQVQDWADTYSKMDPADAAAIMEQMTSDTDMVAKGLLCMTAKQRAEILAEMDTTYAAQLTKIMYPNS